jgi:hypothetical protein
MQIHDLNYLAPATAQVSGGDLTLFAFDVDLPPSPSGNYASKASSFAEIIADQGGTAIAQGTTTIGEAIATASVNALSSPIVQTWFPIATNLFNLFDAWF